MVDKSPFQYLKLLEGKHPYYFPLNAPTSPPKIDTSTQPKVKAKMIDNGCGECSLQKAFYVGHLPLSLKSYDKPKKIEIKKIPTIPMQENPQFLTILHQLKTFLFSIFLVFQPQHLFLHIRTFSHRILQRWILFVNMIIFLIPELRNFQIFFQQVINSGFRDSFLAQNFETTWTYPAIGEPCGSFSQLEKLQFVVSNVPWHVADLSFGSHFILWIFQRILLVETNQWFYTFHLVH